MRVDSFQQTHWSINFQVRNETGEPVDFAFVTPGANGELNNLVFNGSGQNVALTQTDNGDGNWDISITGTVPRTSPLAGNNPTGSTERSTQPADNHKSCADPGLQSHSPKADATQVKVAVSIMILGAISWLLGGCTNQEKEFQTQQRLDAIERVETIEIPDYFTQTETIDRLGGTPGFSNSGNPSPGQYGYRFAQPDKPLEQWLQDIDNAITDSGEFSPYLTDVDEIIACDQLQDSSFRRHYLHEKTGDKMFVVFVLVADGSIPSYVVLEYRYYGFETDDGTFGFTNNRLPRAGGVCDAQAAQR